jgi:cation diffusion facilitator family transporter
MSTPPDEKAGIGEIGAYYVSFLLYYPFMNPTARSVQMFSIRLSLVVGAAMLAIKWYAYAITGSAAILSDAAESVVHIVAVAFAAFSMWLMYQPPDESHPYGHDKISYFSAGVEGFLILLAAGFIIYESVRRLIVGVELENLDTGTYFILGASVINLVLGGYLVRQGKRSNSLILIANGKHVLTDSWTSFGVVGGLTLVLLTGWLPFDPLFAMAVALNIIWSGAKLIRQSVGGLMDEANPELERSIRAVLDAEATQRGLRYHELRYRESGNSIWVEYHLLFEQNVRLYDAHQAATEIEAALSKSLPKHARIVSHLEPLKGHDEAHGGELQH